MKFLQHLMTLLILCFALKSSAEAQTQNIDAGCGTNVGNIHQSTVTINVDCASQRQNALSFNYSRLFGAFEVPLLMDIISEHVFDDSLMGSGYKEYLDSKHGERQVVHSRLVKFRNQYPYRDSRPILTEFWNDIAGSEEAAENIGWRASSGVRNDRICFFVVPSIDGGSRWNIEELKRLNLLQSEAACKENIKRFNWRIGFTFLIIQNTSSEALDDVTFYYRQNYLTNRFKIEHNGTNVDFKGAVDNIPTQGDSLTNLIKQFGKARETENDVADLTQEYKYAGRLEPGQKLIALLNIFVANQINLPASYMYGIYNYEEVAYSIKGFAYRTTIRRPSKERAARIQVPFGWFMQ